MGGLQVVPHMHMIRNCKKWPYILLSYWNVKNCWARSLLARFVELYRPLCEEWWRPCIPSCIPTAEVECHRVGCPSKQLSHVCPPLQLSGKTANRSSILVFCEDSVVTLQVWQKIIIRRDWDIVRWDWQNRSPTVVCVFIEIASDFPLSSDGEEDDPLTWRTRDFQKAYSLFKTNLFILKGVVKWMRKSIYCNGIITRNRQ